MDEGTWISDVFDGYSVDNIPPQAPGDLLASLGDTGVDLEWGEVNESNFMYYNVYRNGEIIVQVADGNFTDAYTGSQVPYYYSITAVDDAGNESAPTPESMVNVTDLNWFINLRGILMGSESDLFNFIGTADDATAGFDESDHGHSESQHRSIDSASTIRCSADSSGDQYGRRRLGAHDESAQRGQDPGDLDRRAFRILYRNTDGVPRWVRSKA